MTFFLGLKGFTTNSANLYSASVSLNALVPGITLAPATLITGCVGIALSLLPLLENLEMALTALAVTTSSLGALFLISYKKTLPKNGLPLTAWLVGVCIGICSLLSLITLTGEPVCDAFLATLLVASPVLIATSPITQELQ